jgi:hypothetical protein
MNSLDRRSFLAYFSAIGMTSTLFPGALWALAESKPKIERSMIDEAADIAGVEIKDEYKEMMLKDLNEQVQGYDEIRKLNIPNSVPPALVFDPVPAGMKIQMEKRPLRMSEDTVKAPQRIEDVAFHRVRQLAELMRTKRISSVALTEMYYERIKRYDPILHFAITLTTERALAQAREADREIAAGKYRGPLHGLPWGAKDLLSVKGYRTTWGAAGFEQQQFDTDATVVARLDRAGAVLLGKFTLGALAMGDVWFGGMTRDAWPSLSAARPSAPSRRPPRGWAPPACGRHSGACRAPARWRSPGPWTRSAPSAARWKIARWCWARSTDPTGRTTPCAICRSTGTLLSISASCASVTCVKTSNGNRSPKN